MTVLSGPIFKPCRKCGVAKVANTDNFYRNAGCKYGLTPRCKLCVDEDNRASRKARKSAHPDCVREQARQRSKRHYHRNLEISRARQCAAAKRARESAEKGPRIRMRKRADGAGLTPEQFDSMLSSQNGRCAICRTDEPASKLGPSGWNLDHCHRTKRVRFILCGACNRGLGAFRDDPTLLRQAASLLEEFRADPRIVGNLELTA